MTATSNSPRPSAPAASGEPSDLYVGASFEQEAAQPLSFFEQRPSGSTIFAGFRGEGLLGTAGFMPETGAKRAHKAHLWGMYVRQAARGTGLARLLVEAVLDHARGRAELVQLSVVSTNAAARRLYALAWVRAVWDGGARA